MGRCTWIWAATLCLVASGTLGATNEPGYDGHTLSEWLLIFGQCKPSEQLVKGGLIYATPQDIEEAKQCDRARKAIRAIGTNALPILLQRIQSENRLEAATLKLPEKIRRDPTLNGILFPSSSQPTVADLALAGFDALGPIATPAIPQLTAFMCNPKNPATAERAVEALARVGPDAVPHLLTALANPRTPSRELVAGWLGRMPSLGTNHNQVEIALRSCLSDKNPEVRIAARTSIGLLARTPASPTYSTGKPNQ